MFIPGLTQVLFSDLGQDFLSLVGLYLTVVSQHWSGGQSVGFALAWSGLLSDGRPSFSDGRAGFRSGQVSFSTLRTAFRSITFARELLAQLSVS